MQEPSPRTIRLVVLPAVSVVVIWAAAVGVVVARAERGTDPSGGFVVTVEQPTVWGALAAALLLTCAVVVTAGRRAAVQAAAVTQSRVALNHSASYAQAELSTALRRLYDTEQALRELRELQELRERQEQQALQEQEAHRAALAEAARVEAARAETASAGAESPGQALEALAQGLASA
jgi:preprotein translocase subunit SecF